MKIVVIADVHGRDMWKEQVKEPADMYIFLGDYFDSFDIDGRTQINNFKDIQAFYQENKDKVVLLTGNHDLSYMDGFCACSGYQNMVAYEISQLVKPMRENGDMKACKVIKNHIFVHAGITKVWLEKYEINTSNLEEEINSLFIENLDPFCFQRSLNRTVSTDNYGDNFFQSPMWVRPNSLKQNKLDNYQQIVGHTRVDKVEYLNGIWLTDCQDSSNDFLILEL